MDYLGYIFLFMVVQGITAALFKLRGNLTRDWIRRLAIYKPLALPMVYYGVPALSVRINFYFYAMALGAPAIALVLQIRDMRPYFNKQLALLLPPVSASELFWVEYTLGMSAILEEIFYRAYVPHTNLLYGLALSTGLFAVAHMLHRSTRKSLSATKQGMLIGLGATWYLTTVLSHSLLPAILGHLAYNSPKMAAFVIRYRSTSIPHAHASSRPPRGSAS